MRFNRILISTTLVIVALVLQVSVLARLQLPGATPDLLLLTVLGLALVYGHTSGAIIGFGAGLLADLAPPADHAVGRYALVLCVIGYAAGLTKPESGQHRSATAPMVVVAVAAVSSTLLYAGVGALVGDTAARHVGIVGLLLTATLYDLLLAPFTVPVVMAIARRADPDPLSETTSGGTGAGGDNAIGWISGGSGGKLARGGMKPRRGSGLVGARGGGMLSRATSKTSVGRIKDVKRL
ncbi:rod shape-determining protein MreD [Streptomyces sp. XM4193]|uniref:rod shape-determining protein MreD n=1 Tax=Streptomyces sp. XM4193 TaxID=2929782 RepID=UPI001FFB3DC7|nr:rod shape-determining protein MreD [Streptomyces sp. XM4193]MCK1795848.1 rod shape-determining protein MreD [Streptomyces sp. XM4193]